MAVAACTKAALLLPPALPLTLRGCCPASPRPWRRARRWEAQHERHCEVGRRVEIPPRRKPRAPLPVIYIEAAGTTTLAGLVALVNAPSPDAPLVAACDRLLYLRDQQHELYRMAEPGYLKMVRATIAEQDRLEAEIRESPPATHAGRRAKAEVVMSLLSNSGTLAAFATAVLRDFMQADGCAA
jgi:hypothetical protein